MPADDLVINVKQIAGYPSAQGVALPTDDILLQRGGLGGPYLAIAAENLVGTALLPGAVTPLQVGLAAPADAAPGQVFMQAHSTALDGWWMWNAYAPTTAAGATRIVSGPAAVINFDPADGWQFGFAVSAAALTPVNGWEVNFLISPTGYVTSEQMLVSRDPVSPLEVATAQYVSASVLGSRQASVTSFNGKVGDIHLTPWDIMYANGAPIFSPIFQGCPMSPTPDASSHSTQIATTAFVHRNTVEYLDNLLACHPFVFTFNGRSGQVVLTATDIAEAAGGSDTLFDSPIFTGIPIAPTAPPGTNTDQIATTAFVVEAIANAPYAPLDSPQFTGFPSGPTAPPGSSTGQLATTAFVMDAVAASVAGVATWNERTGNVVLTGVDITGAGGALLLSPVFTGTPQGPTAAPGTANQQLATTAFVMGAVGGIGVETFNGRAGNVTLTTADITGAGGAPIASPALTGLPSAPTANPGTNTTQIATTQFVAAALSSGGVTSFNTRTGAITLLASDISAAGGATLVSPVFTGIPVAPTAAANTGTNQIATCAFVEAAIGGAVQSFNGRTGNVNLTAADLSAAGGATLASPHFTGTPTAPTATAGDNSTALATTAFVAASIAASAGVTTFNGRAGAVTLSAADVSGAGGALIASPTFIGTPAAPTAAAGTTSTQLATCAFVANAISAGGGVQSFNGRAGVVTLSLADVTTAFPASTVPPLMDAATASVGVSAAWSRGDHAHPTDTTRAAAAALANYLPLVGGSLSGALTVTPQLTVNAPAAGQARNIYGSTNTVARWIIQLGNGAAESGSNAGSDFSLINFADNGSTQIGAMTITRSTGIWNFLQANPTINLTKNASGGSCQIQGFTAGAPRWSLYLGNGGAETGNSAGSIYALQSYTDQGVVQTLCSATRNPNTMSFTNAIINGSDARMKENIRPIADALGKVLALKGVMFNRITRPGHDEIGLIAQDVRKVVPEVVEEMPPIDDVALRAVAPSGVLLGVSYGELTALLIEAIKTLTLRVEDLEGAAAPQTS